MSTLASLLVSLGLDHDSWTKGTTTIRGDLDKFAADVDRVGTQAGAQFIGLATTLAKIPAAAAGISTATGAIAEMGGALGVLPAAAVAAAIAVNTVKIGVEGFGEAIDSIGDPKAFAAAVGELAPNAQSAARAARDLAPAWGKVKDAVQEELFIGVGDAIREVGGTYMPLLKTGLVGVAGGFDNAVSGMRGFASEAQTQ
ncbi:MAG TPA: hypothetical protein VM677_08400, partial [Actinokineospora sp.]|nr:hypothetical protein [Actinokineospora sp.]